MLFTKAVSQPTFDLLKKIAAIKELSDFRLAGGTALSLQIGHRISYDLDFFCFCRTENEQLMDYLSICKPFSILAQSKNLLALNINNIKVDFVKYSYPFLEKPQIHSGIALASLKDIAGMKIAAITGRGRKRDFIDLFFLLKSFTLKEVLAYYKDKYADGNDLMALRSLVYFEDAETDPDVVFIEEGINWDLVKNDIISKVNEIAG